MASNHTPGMDRRRFLQLAGTTVASTALAAPMIVTSRKALAAENLTVVSWGGNYHQGVEEALAKPFEKEFGIHVTLVDTPDLAKVKAQVMTNNVQWDVFDAPGSMAFTGLKNSYWESLDPALFNASDLIAPVGSQMVPFYGFTGGVCWDGKRFPDGKHPQTFADYFDVKRFPGPRTLRNRAFETLEIALLADGVPPEKVYPLDVDRAFKALDRIKPNIANWVEQTPQTVTLVQSGQVDFSYTYATRVKAAQEANQPIDFSFKQTLTGLEYLVVLKNAPNRKNAMKFLQFALRPDRQAALMNLHGNTPASKSARQMMDPSVRKWLSDPNNKSNLLINDAYWGDHFDELTLRFKEWALA
ncbi:ABC transporter substrate-binding protein [Paraburkholderia aromaticivorans]|uniref:ABC transporter substrate-binding protein n=1 Tax=Paraburkholderia aromaticivorans TaxID=2026199 RepID=UPI0038BC0ECC